MKIDLANFGGPVYTGRPRGVAARKKLKLDGVPKAGEVVEVTIPDSTYTMTSSYFLGLFGPSVRLCGSKGAFLTMFNFSGPDRVLARLDDWVDRALREKGTLI
jgi:hypothetical protein